ncbi:MAG: hypothetical protein M3279_11400 [Actinomycetota bacterium]|nr:hypothetical protein [Actinomycetota bacterium]
MEAGEWIGVVGAVSGVASLVLHVVRFVGEGKRFAASQRREDTQEDHGYLVDLRGRLQDLKDTTLAYLNAPPDDAGKQAVLALSEPLEFLAERAQWHDVRTAALHVVYTCQRATSPFERDLAEDRPGPSPEAKTIPGLKREIEWAMAEASRVIGARIDETKKERRAPDG